MSAWEDLVKPVEAGDVPGTARREFDQMNGYAGSLVVLLRQRPLKWQADVAAACACLSPPLERGGGART